MSTNYFYINKMNQNYYLRHFEQVMSPNLCRGSPTIGQDHKDGWNSMVCINNTHM